MLRLLQLQFLLIICLPLLSYADSSESNTPKCFNVSIPYPFGIAGQDSLPGFEITCGSSGPMLSINNTVYGVLSISLLQGYVSILGSAIAHNCAGNFDDSSIVRSDLSLEGTNFTFSDTRNKFTAVSCGVMAMILNDSSGSHGAPRYSGGCVSFCSTNSSIINGTCSGVGCCQAPVPRGLKTLHLEFTSIPSQLRKGGQQCNQAFIAEQYVFSSLDLNRNQQYRPVVLEWSIDGGSCEEVKGFASYACKGNSYCYNSSNGIGYRCNCSKGFAGNPYLQGPDGCQDINECMDEPCTHKCVNTVGSFNCMCPLGMIGDGLKQGASCNGVGAREIAIGAGLALVVVLLALGFWTHWLVKKRKIAKLRQGYFLQNGGILLQQQQMVSRKLPLGVFTSRELEKATNSFSDDHIVGRGGYGKVYKGLLSDQTVVAIKKSLGVDQSQMEQFINELVILSQINHKNVVKLLGCCFETEVPLLVYEFIPNGTLFHHLHKSSVPMSWEDRLRIAVETASALAHLHLATKIPIVHRDVKSANILLDESFTSKVSDFGASRLVPYNQTHVTTLVQGTLGYLDPEYFQTSQLTEKSDVYSFGVVLVELLTREQPGMVKGGRNLAWRFTELVQQNRLLDIVDSRVGKEAGMRHVNVVAQLAVKCLGLKGEERPRMIQVAITLGALRRLMKQDLAMEGEEEQLLREESQFHHQEMYGDE